ncbi:tRNA(Ile)-lysidine synthase [bioreactor metagenome]|jgi:tRNA(Ile)-lysidine synthase|uniref:tRNA(Ile)-lysidine synthetase n=1 Tax=bioreactor metagenome TaxID=1076179 RepID=A0A644U3Z7_9ZZZZ|nr:tRNA lysidine(34) synthetase TilS [Bacteroidales bacterium]MEA4968516.1 tRNA lysidine(34) synthetase TilS [Bacteroidaceae bacterium]MEA5100826.1 tRNA lysidine(34) synthetase TilS [Bacteroidales bacterium]
MVNRFIQYVKEHNLFENNQTILLAVSGGIDSMILCDLFLKSNFKFAIAHCNFHLRGEESNRDERFVREYAQKNNIKIHVKDFDTYSYMKEKGKSMQVSAREMRYSWFNELLKEEGYSYIATGHHIDDSIETFFMNILRGTGIAGLHGILQKVNLVIHPLLFTGRAEIVNYQKENKLEFVEDSSNATTKYTRNKIRHELIPLVKEIAPNFDKIISKEIERFRETEVVFRSVINDAKTELLEIENQTIKISIEKLKSYVPQKIFMYEILSDFGFNEATINSIEDALLETSGKQFYSETHRLVKDRDYLLIVKNKPQNLNQYLIEESQTSVYSPIILHMEILKDLQYVKIPKNKEVAMLDYDKLSFPLILRKWKKGDSFFPYGLQGEKKISEFYKNLKYSILDKENQWLLCSENDIIWVVGQRIDDRYKITKSTKTIYKIELD